MRATLYIDSDGTCANTVVMVIGEDGAYLGELANVDWIDWELERRGTSRARLVVTKVPGRFLANDVLVKQLHSRRDPLVRAREAIERLKRIMVR